MSAALELANALENLEATGWGGDCFALTDYSEKQAELAAAELRRLDAELAECKAAYESQFKELHALKAQRDSLLEALRVAVRQNEHDMLMTGEELRAASATIAATGSRA